MERITEKGETIDKQRDGWVLASFDSRQSQFVWEVAMDHGVAFEIFPVDRQHIVIFPSSKWSEAAHSLEERGVSFQHSMIAPTGEISGDFLQTVEEWREEGA